MKLLLTILIITLITVGGVSSLAAETDTYRITGLQSLSLQYPNYLSGYFITVYGGRYTDRHLAEKVLMLKPIYYEDSWLLSLAIGRVLLDHSNFYRLEVEGQFANHVGEQSHHEFNLVFSFRLRYQTESFRFPLTFAFGNGVSYATQTPPIEERSRTNVNASKLLHYILLEIASELPYLNHWEAVGRIHHRSGVFGLYNNVRGGSNIMAAGLRYNF